MAKSVMYSIVGMIVLVLLGGLWYFTDILPERAVETESSTLDNSVTSQPITAPQLTYENAYNGLLYLTGEKLGDEFPENTYFSNTRRNGVATSIVYFGIESKGDAKVIKNVLTRYPGQVIPFFSPGYDSEEMGQKLGSELLQEFQDGYNDTVSAIGDTVLKGMGELEFQNWPVPHNDPKIHQLVEFAAQNKLAIMFHMKVGQKEQLSELLKKYPDTVFLMHLFHNDFQRDRQNILDLMKDNPNLNYTIDADHLLFDQRAKIGLLYKYQEESAKEGATKFIADFDAQHPEMLATAHDLFSPLVTQFPDRVTLGTEMSTDYSFEPEVYDRIIKHVRLFAGKFSPEMQEKLAHQNAERLFGNGVTLP